MPIEWILRWGAHCSIGMVYKDKDDGIVLNPAIASFINESRIKNIRDPIEDAEDLPLS